MRLHGFLNVVPRAVRIAACAVVCCAVLIGVVVGITRGQVQNGLPPALSGLLGMGMGLLAGTFAALWILCLGYVYADARRRAMPAVLWTLLAALVPNLLGFLFYFALRKPTLSQCPRCGRAVETGQRFCAFCGLEQFSSASTGQATQIPSAHSGAASPQ